jgi:small GTP-binding protein
MNNITKTTLIGASTTGKTSIVNRMKYGSFTCSTECTIGASYTRLRHDDIVYEFWDTAGQERFHALLPMYFRNSKIVIFVFDVSEATSLDVLNNHIKVLSSVENYKIIVVGNKTDLITETEIQNISEILKMRLEGSPIADKIYDYILISAKTGHNFDLFMTKLYNCAKKQENVGRLDEVNIVRLEPPVEKKWCSGCQKG